MENLPTLAQEQNGYLTTTGRRTGTRHTIEIWFAAAPAAPTLYLLAGGGYRADWVKNLQQQPAITFRIRGTTFNGQGRVVLDQAEEGLARRLVVKKYYQRDQVATTGWEATALPVALDLQE